MPSVNQLSDFVNGGGALMLCLSPFIIVAIFASLMALGRRIH
jgi:hypothetical protein